MFFYTLDLRLPTIKGVNFIWEGPLALWVYKIPQKEIDPSTNTLESEGSWAGILLIVWIYYEYMHETIRQSLQSFFNETFYFEVTVDSHAVVRNNTEKSQYPLPVSPNGSCSTRSESGYWLWECWDTEYTHCHEDRFCCPFIATPTAVPSFTPGHN